MIAGGKPGGGPAVKGQGKAADTEDGAAGLAPQQHYIFREKT